ncbi:MAG: c-type cytochrome biogenesis protein CcmI [Gammaproteobacteria bacterium]|nr:c-type cytochrome biogenesis protein CcmI [Gammaproteobacteria bacterium]
MSVFWVVAAMMMVIALVFLLPPLLRRESEITVARDALNIRIYQDQLNELGNDLKMGTISAAQFDQAGRDLQRKLLEDVPGDVQGRAIAKGSTGVAGATTGHTPGHTAPAFAGRWTALTIALLVPLLSTVLYLQLDHVRENVAVPPMADGSGGFSPQMMVQRLEQRLQEQPEDGAGWMMLARSYSALGRYADAREAYARALPLVGEQPELLADYAEVMALSSPNQDLSGRPTELTEKALALDHDNPKALWLSGMAAFQRLDYPKAAATWKRLLVLMPADVEGVQTVQQHIAEAEARAAQMGNTPNNKVKAKK